MPTARRKLVAARAKGIALGTPRLLRRSVAPISAAKPAARENPITAVVGIWNANPEYFEVCPPWSSLNQRRKPQMNMSTPSRAPIMESIRSRFIEAPESYDMELRAMGTSCSRVDARDLRLPSVSAWQTARQPNAREMSCTHYTAVSTPDGGWVTDSSTLKG